MRFLKLFIKRSNPKAVQDINKYLDLILEKKPWLASSVREAVNRYARAAEIVEDYKHLVEEKPVARKSQQPMHKELLKTHRNRGLPLKWARLRNLVG